MDTTAAGRLIFVALLIMLSVQVRSSSLESSLDEVTDRFRNGPYGLSTCLLGCDGAIIDCGLQCLFKAPLKCLINCIIPTTTTVGDPAQCVTGCVDAVLECFTSCQEDAPGPLPPAL
ncbi:hypothetical protein SAY87_018502 [Trapa incisa]|uniref:Uncharacterized protein n=2 Tax=Trapa TaxID=22665 RepID=A0AAN7LN87_TRANT|nr:hypothetical protein SAY87_018502 [Trapa incisa]KAK4784255.1 hypothetical protein SAY86_018623 [Trapa natans]